MYLVSVPYPEDNKSDSMRAPEYVTGATAAGYRGHLAPEKEACWTNVVCCTMVGADAPAKWKGM